MARLRWLLVLTAVLVGVGIGAAAAGWSRSRTPRAPPPSDPRMVTFLDEQPPRPDPPPGAPNLVLVIGCTVRKDQTSIHAALPTTPFLASLAADGARLDDLVSSAPWTRAASTALLTGFHPISVGMAEPLPTRDERVLDPRVLTLAEHLRANGYATAGLVTNPNLNRIYGFDQGFDAYRQLAKLWRETGTRIPGDVAVREAVALLDVVPSGRPLYLEVVLVDAHAPYGASARELATFSDPTVPDAVVRYRAALRRTDRAVGELDRLLRARGLGPENTVWAFVNDHGDALGWPDPRAVSHGRELAAPAVGGVFVVRGPEIPPGGVVRGLASQIDVAPTLVGLLDLPPFPSDGIDLSDALRGRAAAPPRTHVFTETWFKEVDRAAIYTADTACQLDFARPSGSVFDGCFDRATDPAHRSPHADPGLAGALRDWRSARTRQAARFGEVGQAPFDAATHEQLEALGYTADSP